MKRNLFSKTLGLSLAIALVLAPVANLAVVRDNVGGMDTSVSQEGNTPNGGATEDQILEGYGAYVDGVLVEGNIPTANVTDTTITDLTDTITIPGHTYIDEDLMKSSEMAMLMHQKISNVLKEQMKLTIEEIKSDYVRVQRLANALIDKTSMTGDEIKAVLEEC